MPKSIRYTISVLAFILLGVRARAQSPELFEQVGLFLNDALFYSDHFITPATDAAVYQASSNWVNTPKKKELWDLTLGFHTNVFFVPQRDRFFTVSNDNFEFLTIEGASQVNVPTALGHRERIFFTGDFDGNEVRIQSPDGVNMNTVIYPYLQASLGLWYGTELMVRYSTKVKLKKGHYQVYGFGLQHNLSQYFSSWKEKKIHLAVMGGYSNEEISFEFLNLTTDFGDLGLNALTGFVDTYQFQLAGSKEWGRWELMSSIIANSSNFRYVAGGDSSQSIIPFTDMVNAKLREIYKTKVNTIGEISGRYQLSKLYFQTSIAFGKFVNSNFSIQYEF